MQKIELTRVAKNANGVFGTLAVEGMPFAVTAELPDHDNAVGKSCIPFGVYRCKKITSPSKGKCISVTEVRGRTSILMHVGNVPVKDSQGCILVGEKFEDVGGNAAIQESRKGFGELLRVADDEFMLYIREA